MFPGPITKPYQNVVNTYKTSSIGTQRKSIKTLSTSSSYTAMQPTRNVYDIPTLQEITNISIQRVHVYVIDNHHSNTRAMQLTRNVYNIPTLPPIIIKPTRVTPI